MLWKGGYMNNSHNNNLVTLTGSSDSAPFVAQPEQRNGNHFLPKSFEQAERLSQMIAKSTLCPPSFKNKPEDVYIAMQMGAELGLSPMQAIQNIAVINGRPCVYGDALLALVRSHKHCEGVREWMEGSKKDKNAVAYCEIRRRGQPPEVRSFSYEQAIMAALINKAGPWQQYFERMLQLRARGFCARDVFPDALRGLNLAEEVMDYEVVNTHTQTQAQISQSQTKYKGVNAVKSALGLLEENKQVGEGEVIDQTTGEISNEIRGDIKFSKLFYDIEHKIEHAINIDQLLEAIDLARSLPENEKVEARKLYKSKSNELTQKELEINDNEHKNP